MLKNDTVLLHQQSKYRGRMYKIYNLEEKKYLKNQGWTSLTIYFTSEEKALNYAKKICRETPTKIGIYKVIKANGE